jgi:hypothetical protein
VRGSVAAMIAAVGMLVPTVAMRMAVRMFTHTVIVPVLQSPPRLSSSLLGTLTLAPPN